MEYNVDLGPLDDWSQEDLDLVKVLIEARLRLVRSPEDYNSMLRLRGGCARIAISDRKLKVDSYEAISFVLWRSIRHCMKMDAEDCKTMIDILGWGGFLEAAADSFDYNIVWRELRNPEYEDSWTLNMHKLQVSKFLIKGDVDD